MSDGGGKKVNPMVRNIVIRAYFRRLHRRVCRFRRRPTADQQRIFQNLLRDGKNTAFGMDHHFGQIRTYADFKACVPLVEYENLSAYIQRIAAGEKNVLYRGRPAYFARTSGTTSGIKYIPLTRQALVQQILCASYTLACFAVEKNRYDFFDGKMIFLSGSPSLSEYGKIATGRLSGIVNHYIPALFKTRQMPSFQTNTIEDWTEKLRQIVRETQHADMRLISGIPPWLQMYFEYLLDATHKKTIRELFPHFSVLVYGGVGIRAYAVRLKELIGGEVDMLETFPASEGFIAFQDSSGAQGLLLNTNAGMFFEFVPVDTLGQPNPPRLCLAEVECGKNYALVLNTNAGLWGYLIGDTVRFVSRDPYRVVVTGRTKHFLSAFGEHVIVEEVESVMNEAQRAFASVVSEFTVVPLVAGKGQSRHEWYVEFCGEPPQDLSAFAAFIDTSLRKKNIYYDDLVRGQVLLPARVKVVSKNAFNSYMQQNGKLGGQNKVPHLLNDRTVGDHLECCVYRMS